MCLIISSWEPRPYRSGRPALLTLRPVSDSEATFARLFSTVTCLLSMS